MSNGNFYIYKKKYLQFCTNRKNLNNKTIKSYSIDLEQFEQFVCINRLESPEKVDYQLFSPFIQIISEFYQRLNTHLPQNV